MEIKEFQDQFLEADIHYIFHRTKGYVTWLSGTGGNVEITHLRAFELRKGCATFLITEMCRLLQFNPPYHSVYVFCLKSNTSALAAYKSFGFTFTEIPNLYRDDGTMLGTVSFTDLYKNMGL